jgi:predicted transcriptional regulator
MPKTRHRTIRVPDDLWQHAQAIAKARGETLSDIIRDALRRYVKRHEEK